MEESAELSCDKSCIQIDAYCKTFPQDFSNGQTWSADTRGANRTSRQAALGALVLSELEQHLDMNRVRLGTYEQVRSGIQAFIEARRSQFAFKTGATKSTSQSVGQIQRINPTLVAIKTKEAKENRRELPRQRSRLFGTGRTSCSGSTTATSSGELSGVGVD